METKPFNVGDKVTSDYHRGEEDIERTITWCEKSGKHGSGIRYGSGYSASADGGEPCRCCGATPTKPIGCVDSTWFNSIKED